MVTDRAGPTITTLKAEVDFLSDELRQVKAENKQLLEENSSLSAWQCVYMDGKTGLVGDEHGNQYCAMAKEVERFRTENERLREWNREIALNAREFAEALREIIDFDTDEDISNEECMRDIARAALDGQPAPGKEEA